MPGEHNSLVAKLEHTLHRLRIDLSAAEGQRNRAREIADALAPALRRCCEDSKDLLAGRSADKQWVGANIQMAEEALDLHEAKDWA